MIYNLCNDLFNEDINNIDTSLKNYFNSDILNQLYFVPKKIDNNLIGEKISDKNYIDKVLNTISYYKNNDIESLIKGKINQFIKDTNYCVDNYKLYVTSTSLTWHHRHAGDPYHRHSSSRPLWG